MPFPYRFSHLARKPTRGAVPFSVASHWGKPSLRRRPPARYMAVFEEPTWLNGLGRPKGRGAVWFFHAPPPAKDVEAWLNPPSGNAKNPYPFVPGKSDLYSSYSTFASSGTTFAIFDTSYDPPRLVEAWAKRNLAPHSPPMWRKISPAPSHRWPVAPSPHLWQGHNSFSVPHTGVAWVD